MKAGVWGRHLGVLLLAAGLAACGGGSGFGPGGGTTTGPSTGNPGNGGTSGTGIPGKIDITTTGSATPANPVVIADGASQVTVQATVSDTAGQPVPSQPVHFTSSAGTPVSGSATTDAAGHADFVLTAPTVAGPATVTAAGPGVSSSLVVQFVAGAAHAVTLSPSTATVQPGGVATFIGTLVDANNNPKANAAVAVRLQPGGAGGAIGSAGGAGGLQNGVVQTDANGQFALQYAAGNAIGSDTIVADAGSGVSASAVITVSATAVSVGSLVLTLGSASITAGDAAGVTASAQVMAVSGGAVGAGQPVRFAATDGTFTGGAASGGIASVIATTDAQGVARATFLPPTHATSAVNIRATASGFADEKTLAVVAGPAVAARSTISAAPSTLLADGHSTTTVTVTEADQFGNALPDGTPVTVQSTAGTLAGNNGTLSSGRATFILTAPTSAATGSVSVPAVSGLSTTVTFTGASSGDPASVGFKVTDSQINVAGVGQNQQTQITVTVLDSAGNPIDESKYGNPALDNLEAKFIAQPNGGESLSGTQASGAIATASAGTLDVRTNNGVATFTLSAGTISGIVEIQFSVLKFAGTSFSTPADVAASGALPQVSIAAGPAYSMTFSGPITNAVEVIKAPDGSNSGNYGLHGKVDVRDRYGNFVPDGTVVNFSLMDSVILQDATGTTTAGSPKLQRSGNSLVNRRCGNQPGGTPNAPTEASGCNPVGSNTAASDFTSTILRNGVARGIQPGDLVLIRDTDSQDKKRTVSSVTGATQLVVNSGYGQATSNAMFWVGSALSGGAISGYAADGTTLTPGTGVVENGFAPFRVDYPANVGSILLGCYGYGNNGAYSDIDLRDAVPQSRQVVVSADAGSVSSIDAGDFCFKAVLGARFQVPTASLSLADGGDHQALGITLVDGGDTVPLPYVPVSCFQSAASVKGNYTVTASITPDSDGEQRTDVGGHTTVTFTTGVGPGQSGDSVTYTCTAADASQQFTITHP